MDGCGIYHQIDVVSDIFRTLADGDACSLCFQMAGKLAGFLIGTGDGEISGQKDLCQRAHADTADTDKMNMYR